MGKILVVDDEKAARELARWVLESEGYEVATAAGAEEALFVQEQGRLDLVLLDVMMPGLDGWEVCKRIKERAGTFLPVVMLTSRSGVRDKAEACRRGADDFLSKPFNAEELLVKVWSMLRIKRNFDRLEAISISDPLTGVHTRRHWAKRLKEECDSALRGGPGLSCLMLDLDGFKTVNDVHGHPAGDDLLRRVGRCLRGLTRNSDVLVRYGGDEFIMLFPNTPPGVARGRAEKILQVVREILFNGAPLSVSGGLCGFPASDIRTPEALMREVDAVLYRAKGQGRNRLCVRGGDDGTGGKAEKKTAVVVDDQEDTVRLYKEALESAGFEVLTASDGKRGIDTVLEVRPDLVVLDVVMPVMQGYDACCYLRQRGDMGRTKVMMVSGKSLSEDKRWADRVGADAYLVKPVALEELARRARQLVGLPSEAFSSPVA